VCAYVSFAVNNVSGMYPVHLWCCFPSRC